MSEKCDHVVGLGYGDGLSIIDVDRSIKASETPRHLLESYVYCPLCGERLCSDADLALYTMLEGTLGRKNDDERTWWGNQLRRIANQLGRKR